MDSYQLCCSAQQFSQLRLSPWRSQGVHPWIVGWKPLQTQAGAAPKVVSTGFITLAHRARGQFPTTGSAGSFFTWYMHMLKCKVGTGCFSERLNNLLILRTEGSIFRGCMCIFL